MTKVISFINEKGGVGKSTTCFNVAWEMSKKHRVLIIDMDGQGANISFFCGVEKNKDMKTMYNMIVEDFNIIHAIKHVHGDLHIIPANISVLNMNSSNADIFKAQKEINKLKGRYEYIFIDCNPSPNWNQVLSLAVSDHVIIPMEGDVTNLESITELSESIDEIRESVNPDLNILGFVLNKTGIMTNLFKKTKEITSIIAESINARVFDTQLRKAVVVAESIAENMGITDYSPKSKAAADMRSLVEEIEKELKKYE